MQLRHGTFALPYTTKLYIQFLEMKRDINLTTVCFVGISFYKSRDKKTTKKSIAQIYNERGNGIILRGTPLEIRLIENDTSTKIICEEILKFSKMNWNKKQIDGKYPNTIERPKRVEKIMKYLENTDKPQISYAFYM